MCDLKQTKKSGFPASTFNMQFTFHLECRQSQQQQRNYRDEIRDALYN